MKIFGQLFKKKKKEPYEIISELVKKEDFDKLIKLFNHENGDMRREAIQRIPYRILISTKPVEPLIQALKDKEWRVREAAAEKLGYIGDKKAIEPLVQAYDDEKWYVRYEASKALGELGDLQYLEKMLGGDDADGLKVAESLMFIGGEKGVSILVHALENNTKYIAAALGLSNQLMSCRKNMDEEKLHKVLIPAIKYLITKIEGVEISSGVYSYERPVTLAIGALGAIGDPAGIPALENLLVRVQNKIKAEGEKREYARTEYAAGYVSSQGSVSHIEQAIKKIKDWQEYISKQKKS